MNPKFPSSIKKQQGVALIVSLIILAVVTLLGMTSMQSSNAELKLASSLRDRGVAFEAAEAALSIIEDDLSNSPPNRISLFSLPSTCTTDCYSPTCTGGLCFDGSYGAGDTEFACQVAKNADTVERKEFWSDSTLSVWTNDARHKKLKIASLDTDVKYIVEFLCFVAKDKTTPFSADPVEADNGAPLFRITALAEGNGKRASVALQSTYKVLNGF